MTRIAVLDDWQGIAPAIGDWSSVSGRAEIVYFREPFGSADATVAALAGFDVVLAMRERTLLNKAVIDRLPDLRLLSFTGPRNAAVDVPACTARGIVVCNTLGSRSSHATAELSLGLMLACARGIAQGDAEIRAGRFQQHMPAGVELLGRTLGVVGLGKIGARMASYGRALGMEVLAWSQNLTDEAAEAASVTKVAKDELMARSDVISLHLVLSDRSRGVVGAADIARMKPGAILVNTSRAQLIDEEPLLVALNARRIVAGLDVYAEEPLPGGHPLRAAPNTVLTPHLGYVTADNMADFYRGAIDNIAKWLDGAPIRVVNPEALPAAAT